MKLMGYLHESFLVLVLKDYCSPPPKKASTESMLKKLAQGFSAILDDEHIARRSLFKNKNSAVSRKENMVRTGVFHGSSFMKCNF